MEDIRSQEEVKFIQRDIGTEVGKTGLRDEYRFFIQGFTTMYYIVCEKDLHPEFLDVKFG